MINLLLHRQIARFERAFGYDMAYGHEMLDTSRTAFLRFQRLTAISRHREDVPASAWYAAKLAAVLGEDCGPCTQLVATMAEQDDVEAGVLRAVIEGDERAMGEDASLGWRFARAVLAHDPLADPLREQIVARWGVRALVSLALGIAVSRVYPTVKFALGHARTCTSVRVGGVDVRPRRAA